MAQLSKEQRRFLNSTTAQYAEHLDGAVDWLEGRGIKLDHARYEGLGVVAGDVPALHDGYRGRLCIPYITAAGVVSQSFRCLKDHDCKESGCVKYLKVKGVESTLYGVRSFDDAVDWIGICEGELDSLILRQIGLPAVAIPGATNWQEHWCNVFEDLSRVYVFADADTAGKKMYKHLADKLAMPVIKVELPSGEDVNSTYTKHGAEAILKRIKK